MIMLNSLVECVVLMSVLLLMVGLACVAYGGQPT
jgi:hypothetical protein